jgi:Transmembrane amino acid transporter protein
MHSDTAVVPSSVDLMQLCGAVVCSAFHNTTAIVGAGVLGLPFAMRYLTWSGGVVIMCLSWFTSLYTLWQVGKCRRLFVTQQYMCCMLVLGVVL